MRLLGRGGRDDLSMARKSYSEELASSGGGPVRDDTGGDGAWDRSGPGDRARQAASVADLVRDRAQDRGRRQASSQPAAPATIRWLPHEQAHAGDCPGGDRASGGGERRAAGSEKSSLARQREILQQAARYFAGEMIW